MFCKKIYFLALLGLMFSAMLFTGGCGGGAGQIDNNSTTASILSVNNQQILDEAGRSYTALRTTMTADNARTSLVASLNNNYPGVKSAGLFEDGYTIFIAFSDGGYGAINTIEGLNEGLSSKQKNSRFQGVFQLKNNVFRIKDTNTPSSKKAILLNAAAYEFSNNNTGIDTAREYLIQRGWNSNDIIVKSNDTPNASTLQPSDFFNLGQYGIVVIMAHGLYGSPPEIEGDMPGNGSNKYFYIQCASSINWSQYDNNTTQQLIQWASQGKLINVIQSTDTSSQVSSKEGFIYIRQDILEEQMQLLPNSFVYLLSCSAWKGRQAFVNNSAGCVIAWDNPVKVVDARIDLIALFNLMAKTIPAMSSSEAYNNSSIQTTSQVSGRPRANLQIYNNSTPFYFPAWAEITISGMPSGWSRAAITITDQSSNIIGSKTIYSDSGNQTEVENLKPVSATASVNVYNNSSQLVSSGEVAATLNAGKTEITVNVTGVGGGGGSGIIAFVSNRTGNWDIYTMNSSGSNASNITNDASVDYRPWWNPAYNKLAFYKGNYDLYVMSQDGSNQIRLATNGNSDERIAWSPDGTKIAYVSGDKQVYRVNSDGSSGSPDNLTNSASTNYNPTWKSDSTKIAFYTNRTGNWEVFVMDSDGSNQTNLTGNAGSDRYPAWSPNGTKIAFQSTRDGGLPNNAEIYVMNPDGSNQTRLTNNSAIDSSFIWSPNSSKIAFMSFRDGTWEIYVMNPDGSGQTRLTNNTVLEGRLTWSPDSLYIAYEAQPASTSYIYKVSIDGSGGETKLTTGYDTSPSWSRMP